MIVVDASVMVDALRGVDRVVGWLSGQWLAAPHLLDAEVGGVVRRLVLAGDLSAEAAGDALIDLAEIEILRYEHPPLFARAWELRDNLTFYDALYVALAEQLDAPLVTLDARLAGAPGIGVAVQVLPGSS